MKKIQIAEIVTVVLGVITYQVLKNKREKEMEKFNEQSKEIINESVNNIMNDVKEDEKSKIQNCIKDLNKQEELKFEELKNSLKVEFNK